MTLEQLVIGAIGIVCGVLGWFARVLYQATQDLRRDLSALEVKISSDYVRYDRLQDAFKPIMDALHDIRQTLKEKVDK